MKTILLTGATGFLGSHLLKMLISQYNVIILKRSFSNALRISDCIDKCVSYNVDEICLETIFQENKIDAIIHCATEYGRNSTSCCDILKTNLMFPIELLELAEKYKVDAFLNTDSYFNKKNRSYPYLLNYSLSKKSLELWLEKFSGRIKIANLMLEHIYGEYDNQDKFVEYMIRQIAINKVNRVNLSNGLQKRDFVYVKDVCRLYIDVLNFILKNDFQYRTIEVGTGKSISIRSFVNTIKKVSQSNTILDFGALEDRPEEIQDSYSTEKEFLITETNTLEKNIENIIQIYNRGKECQ